MIWMRFVLVAGVAACAVQAQSPVPVGERVRVRLFEPERQMETRFQRVQVLRGTLTAFSGDTLFIQPTALTGTLPVPLSSVRTLQRSRGVQSRWAAGIGGAIGGALISLLYVELESRWGDPGWTSRRAANQAAAGFGALVYGGIGFAFPVERWRSVRIR